MRAYVGGAVMAVSLALVSCGGGGGSSGDTTPPPEAPPVNVARTFLSVLIPQALADELPAGYVVDITAAGAGSTQTIRLATGETQAAFTDLLPGDYSLSATATFGGHVVGVASPTIVTVGSEGAQTTLSIPIIRADLEIEPVLAVDYGSLAGVYTGTRKAAGCIDAFFPSADVSISVSEEVVSLNFDIFPDQVLRLTGQLDDTTGVLSASGTYEASDFTSGTWTIAEFKQPNPAAISFSAIFYNNTSQCAFEILYVGLK